MSIIGLDVYKKQVCRKKIEMQMYLDGLYTGLIDIIEMIYLYKMHLPCRYSTILLYTFDETTTNLIRENKNKNMIFKDAIEKEGLEMVVDEFILDIPPVGLNHSIMFVDIEYDFVMITNNRDRITDIINRLKSYWY